MTRCGKIKSVQLKIFIKVPLYRAMEDEHHTKRRIWIHDRFNGPSLTDGSSVEKNPRPRVCDPNHKATVQMKRHPFCAVLKFKLLTYLFFLPSFPYKMSRMRLDLILARNRAHLAASTLAMSPLSWRPGVERSFREIHGNTETGFGIHMQKRVGGFRTIGWFLIEKCRKRIGSDYRNRAFPEGKVLGLMMREIETRSL
ncbi:hypothetical protein TNCV_4498211 [Trichonephila clavipes]|nr:hypothetical protein TNCV_4498211 [Trichonephila clavipes]